MQQNKMEMEVQTVIRVEEFMALRPYHRILWARYIDFYTTLIYSIKWPLVESLIPEKTLPVISE
jgi:hypothetical protein